MIVVEAYFVNLSPFFFCKRISKRCYTSHNAPFLYLFPEGIEKIGLIVIIIWKSNGILYNLSNGVG